MSAVTAILGLSLALQAQGVRPVAIEPAPRTATAARTAQAPVIDGRDTDAAWATALPVSEFRQARPVEDGEPRFRTEFRVAYDAEQLYIFVRAFDPSPDSIVGLLARRDAQTNSDWIWLFIDSYLDRRTGFEFGVNPAGVKLDYTLFNDTNEDIAWDGVWDVSTRIDSLGWTAEFAIPFSQLKFNPSESVTFGLGIWRDIQRFNERVTWPLWRPSEHGFVHQFGELQGLAGLKSPRRAELMPYVVSKDRTDPEDRTGRRQDLTAGADLKYALASNITLNATINPDFGQVEADPSELNLSTFETFFQERRPFFVEGRGLFSFDINCSAVNCRREGLFYSRRIGRSPSLAGAYGDASSPTATSILGAAKVTGRFPGGLAIGVLDAVTNRESGVDDATIEPTTNYLVVRATQDFREGNSTVGGMLTGVNRSLDRYTEPFLHRNAYVGAVDFRHRLFGNRYQVSGALAMSRVAGSREAILATQTSPVHLFQRPDGEEGVDASRTSLTGDAQELRFGKITGDRLIFETAYLRRSPGFELNDIGFLRQADQVSWTNWAGLRFRRPTATYRQLYWNLNWWQNWTTAGLATERAANTNIHMELKNSWWLHAGGTVGGLGTTFCDRCARGGPALRREGYIEPWVGFEGDERGSLVPFLWVNYLRTDGGRSESINLSPDLQLKISSRFSTWLGLSLTFNRDDAQWFGNFTDSVGTTHYTFARLDQTTAAVTWRANFTFTPEMSLQLYASPFVSKGTYSDVRELADPRAAEYRDRFQPYGDPAVTGDPGGFNFKALRSNVVFRWEYRPGSTIFLVWSQGREAFAPAEGNRSVGGDLGELFGLRADDTFLVKVSYWLNW